MNTSKKTEERFFKKVDKSVLPGCWIWTGCKTAKAGDKNARGCFYLNGKLITASRFSYEKFKGHIDDGLFVSNSCGNSLCVNPEHLILKTHSELIKVKTLEERFWEKVDKSAGDNSCWIWTGAGDQHGYGHIFDGRNRKATHVSWEIYNGIPFPEGMHACHSCDNPRCVNPLHIWPGTRHENMQDSVKKGRFSKPSDPFIAQINRNKTHCKRGHEYSDENTVLIKPGKRECRICKKDRDRRYRERKAIVNEVIGK